jgi:hypothetical protein
VRSRRRQLHVARAALKDERVDGGAHLLHPAPLPLPLDGRLAEIRVAHSGQGGELLLLQVLLLPTCAGSHLRSAAAAVAAAAAWWL